MEENNKPAETTAIAPNTAQNNPSNNKSQKDGQISPSMKAQVKKTAWKLGKRATKKATDAAKKGLAKLLESSGFSLIVFGSAATGEAIPYIDTVPFWTIATIFDLISEVKKEAVKALKRDQLSPETMLVNSATALILAPEYFFMLWVAILLDAIDIVLKFFALDDFWLLDMVGVTIFSCFILFRAARSEIMRRTLK